MRAWVPAPPTSSLQMRPSAAIPISVVAPSGRSLRIGAHSLEVCQLRGVFVIGNTRMTILASFGEFSSVIGGSAQSVFSPNLGSAGPNSWRGSFAPS